MFFSTSSRWTTASTPPKPCKARKVNEKQVGERSGLRANRAWRCDRRSGEDIMPGIMASCRRAVGVKARLT
jgi:hypothetical protein